jgi:hypothetical protein
MKMEYCKCGVRLMTEEQRVSGICDSCHLYQKERIAWDKMMANAFGKWTRDTIHNKPDDLILFSGGKEGLFVMTSINSDEKPVLEGGHYTGAIPHIGEASFYADLFHQFDTLEQLYEFLVDTLNMTQVEDLYHKVISPEQQEEECPECNHTENECECDENGVHRGE